MAIAIVDYGMGNLRSVQNALIELGAESELVREPDQLAAYDRIILPGVGAFGEAIMTLRASGLDRALAGALEAGVPVLGICLGMQLMAKSSLEDGRHEGLGWVDADVLPFQPQPGLKIPHMGWNSLRFAKQSRLADGIADGADVYFVHSYHVACNDPADVLATSEYGQAFTAMFCRDNLYGAQFHPEKSQKIGLRVLENFLSV